MRHVEGATPGVFEGRGADVTFKCAQPCCAAPIASLWACNPQTCHPQTCHTGYLNKFMWWVGISSPKPQVRLNSLQTPQASLHHNETFSKLPLSVAFVIDGDLS